jgi:hypothetical protein
MSTSFDAVRVFLSARARIGSVSQSLRLNAAGDAGCRCCGHRNEQAALWLVPSATAQRWLARSLQRTIRALERELKLIDREIAERLGRSTTLKPLHDLITSLPGAGPVLGATLIARIPENHFDFLSVGRVIRCRDSYRPVVPLLAKKLPPTESASAAGFSGTDGGNCDMRVILPRTLP